MAANEADVVEAFVRHNLRYLDAIAVLDHGSLDETASILAQLAGEGLPLVVLGDPERAFRQGARQTELARRFLPEFEADFCFVLDADEFIAAPSRAGLEASLGALPPGCHGLVPLRSYVAGDAAAGDHPLRRLTRRLREERAVSRKVVLRSTFATHPGAGISLGNHAALEVGAGGAVPLAHALLAGVHLAHFPVRSAEQVAKKALLGWLSHRLTRPEDYARAGGPASHWHALFDRLVAGAPVGEALLVEALAAYVGGTGPIRDEELVDDPLPAPCELRYAAPVHGGALSALAAWADRMVTDVNAARLPAAHP